MMKLNSNTCMNDSSKLQTCFFRKGSKVGVKKDTEAKTSTLAITAGSIKMARV